MREPPRQLPVYNTPAFSIACSFLMKCLFRGQSYLQQPWGANFSRVSIALYPLSPDDFFLANHVSSQLGKCGRRGHCPWGSHGPSARSDMQFLALTRCQATGATLKGGSTVEHTGFLTRDRDRAVTGHGRTGK